MAMPRRRGNNTPHAVVKCGDFLRISQLPRRPSFDQLTAEWVEDVRSLMTWYLKTPNGTQELRPVQAVALAEVGEYRGLLGFLPVGSGKTILSLLSCTVLGLKRPLLLTRAALREKTYRDIEEISRNWRIPLPVEMGGTLRILSYEQLSRVKQADVLYEIMPDGIVADEAHMLGHKTAACTKRVLRHVEQFPNVMCVFMSGSLTRKTPRDYGHLAMMALGDGSPLPHRFMALEDWSNAIGDEVPEDQRIHPGALLEFGVPAREGFRLRFVQTPGVIVQSSDEGLTSSLTIDELTVHVPNNIRDAFQKMRSEWQTPGGEEVMTALEFARHAHELANGFYYRWVWPNGEVDWEWLELRKQWRKFVRHVIRYGAAGRHWDTELQVANGCIRQDLDDRHYVAWAAVRDRCNPATEAVWIDDFMVDATVRWMHDNPEKGIVWVDSQAMLSRLLGRVVPPHEQALDALGQNTPTHNVFGAGDDRISLEDGSRTVVASFYAHGTGKNLQAFHKNLFLCRPTEQSLGRTHRSGQQADEVTATLVLNCVEQWAAWKNALSEAAYIEQSTGQKQKLRYCDLALTTTESVVTARARQRDPLWTKDW